MSLRNKFLIMNEIVKKYKNDIGPWVIIYFYKKDENIDIDVNLYFIKNTIHFLANYFSISDSLIYTTKSNKEQLDIFNNNTLNISSIFIDKYTRLKIIKNFMLYNKNIIFIDGSWGITDPDFEIELTNNSLYANVLQSNQNNNIKAFELEYIIDSSIMIIPFNNIINGLIIDALSMIDKINIDNEKLVSDIALSISFKSYKNILSIASLNNLFVSIKDIIIINQIRERYYISDIKNDDNIFEFLYDDPRYIYYPYLDMNSPKKKIIDKINNNYIPKYYNTNNFELLLDDYSFIDIYKRFTENTSGLFLEKKLNKNILIPKILHHVWLDRSPDNKYTTIWKQFMVYPWVYKIWSINDINNFIADSKWNVLYENEREINIKLLIIYFAILEKYGGIVISSFILPRKIFPDFFLYNKIFISYIDEANNGTTLSFRIIGGVPGSLQISENVNSINPNIRRNKLFQENNSINQNIFPEIYNELFKRLLPNISNKILSIEDFLKNLEGIFIYPSYYFNITNSFFYKLDNMGLLIIINQELHSENISKIIPTKSYQITQKSIEARLKENPKNRIANMHNI